MSAEQSVSDDQAQSSGGTWLPRSNSVESSAAGISGSEDSRSYEERVEEEVRECVAKFRDDYPYLAELPLSETPGRELRDELVEEEFVEEYVPGESETDQGYTVRRLERAESVTWATALYRFLTARQAYDDGLGGQFTDTVTGEEFTVDFNDCWTTAYGEKQAARNSGAQRQLMGGEYPDSEESSRAGEVTDGEWTGDTATIMLTRTGSSVPDGERVPPVDHADAVTRTWSQGGVYDTVRNICEFELELDSDQWGYVRGDDVHGMGPFEHEEPGVNACYPHAHDAIYVDLGSTDLREQFDTDVEIKSVLQSKFHKAIQKHVEACEYAKPEAHEPSDSVRVRLDLENPAGYATEYLRLDESEMLDMPVEFQAFAAVEWATNRQRIARSQLFNEAAKADFCIQDSESSHGERLKYDHSGHGDPEVVCAECGSAVGIGASTLTEYRMENDPADLEDLEDVDGDGLVGYSVGESFGERDVREAVEEYIELQGEPESVSLMMGQLGIEPSRRELVESIVEGDGPDPDTPSAVTWGPEPSVEPQYRLDALVLPDGGTEEVSGGGGGASRTALMLPEERLLRETRLKHYAENIRGEGPQKPGYAPRIDIEDGDWSMSLYDAEEVAAILVERGYRRPWHAELALSFVALGDRELPSVFEEPEVGPPAGCQ